MLRFAGFLLAATAAWAQNPAVSIQIDANANRRPINPMIYGTNHATPGALADLNRPASPARRQ